MRYSNFLNISMCFLLCFGFIHCGEKCKDERFYCKDQIDIDGKGTSYSKVYYNGQIVEEYFSLNGIKDSTYISYFKGKMNYILHFKKGKQNGSAIAFFDNGDTSLVQHYQNDTLEGVAYGFYRNGKRKYEQLFKNGICIEQKLFDSIPRSR